MARRALESAGNEAVGESLTNRVNQAVEHVTSKFRSQPQIVCNAITCSVPSNLIAPTVMLSRNARTPAIAESMSPPTLVLPIQVVEDLDDSELEGVPSTFFWGVALLAVGSTWLASNIFEFEDWGRWAGSLMLVILRLWYLARTSGRVSDN